MSRAIEYGRRPATHRSPASPWRGVWLTRAAFVLSAALVLARATMLETLRDPLDVNPGTEAPPDGPGAGSGLVLDLLCCLPALLVLARRVVDPGYALHFAWSLVPLGLLALWTITSTAWAGDKFAAAVGGAHWFCACVFLWSTAQLVRDWAALRLVAALCVGLLLVQVGQGLYYRYVEHPDLVAQWRVDREKIIQQRGWEDGSFIVRQFENRVISGEIMGFTSSPNSYAAVLVLLGFAAAGVLIQRLADRDGFEWAAVPAAAVVLAGVMLVFVGSRTGLATPVIGAGVLAAAWLLRGWLAGHARLAYVAGVSLNVLGAAAVVGHGLYHGSLFYDSLTFRWRYWVAAARLFAEHPLLGVGWENFGPHYLAFRLPIAAEEIKDPHNFVMRFATELGAVGLALLLGWLLRLAWELTVLARSAEAQTTVDTDRIADSSTNGPSHPTTPAVSPLTLIAAVGVVGSVVNVMASVDWSQAAAYNALELLRRTGFLCLFVVGAAPAALRSAHRQDADERAAPWVRVALLTGLALFLLHNLVDFSLFEPGPMFLFTFLCGAALGSRLHETPDTRAHAVTHPRVAVAVILAAASLVWVIAGVALVAPVVAGEAHADAGDAALVEQRFMQSSSAFERALAAVPYNADYAFRAARALLAEPHPTAGPRALPLLDRAIHLDPNRPQYWLHRAYARLRTPTPNPQGVRADYEQALRLDPNNVDVRLEYADVLRRLGDPAAAAGQYREALRYNDLLHPDEPKRLAPKKVEEVRATLREMERAPAPG